MSAGVSTLHAPGTALNATGAACIPHVPKGLPVAASTGIMAPTPVALNASVLVNAFVSDEKSHQAACTTSGTSEDHIPPKGAPEGEFKEQGKDSANGKAEDWESSGSDTEDTVGRNSILRTGRLKLSNEDDETSGDDEEEDDDDDDDDDDEHDWKSEDSTSEDDQDNCEDWEGSSEDDSDEYLARGDDKKLYQSTSSAPSLKKKQPLPPVADGGDPSSGELAKRPRRSVPNNDPPPQSNGTKKSASKAPKRGHSTSVGGPGRAYQRS